MKTQEIDFGNQNEARDEFCLFNKIIFDKGSVYSVSVGRVCDRREAQSFIKKVRNYDKKFKKASHHSYALRISYKGVNYETKSDDGETGAGDVILRILHQKKYTNTIVCVTRWFGGVKLEGDRFKHVQNAAKYGLENIAHH